MRTILRRVIVLLLSLSLAVASGFAPRHAKASAPAPHKHQAAAHDHTTAHAHRHSVAHQHAADCGDTGKLKSGTSTTEQSCCVTSCSAMVAVSAPLDVRHDLPKARFELPLKFGLTLSMLASIEPPPR